MKNTIPKVKYIFCAALLFAAPALVGAKMDKGSNLDALSGLLECDLMANNWFLASIGNAYQKKIYSADDIEGMIGQIQRPLLIRDVDALRKAGLATTPEDQAAITDYSDSYKSILKSDIDLESYLKSGKDGDWLKFKTNAKQLNDEMATWDLATKGNGTKLPDAFGLVLDRSAISGLMVNFFFIGTVSNCFDKSIYDTNQVKGVLGEEEILLEQAKKTLDPLKNGLDPEEKKQVEYYQDCFSEIVDLNHALKTYSASGSSDDHKKFEDIKSKVMKNLTAFTTEEKEK